MNRTEQVVLAHRMHEVILAEVRKLRTGKVQVYFLLREFKRSRLYRWVEAPICAAHRKRLARPNPAGPEGDDTGQSCAERRFPTWEDYLVSLGDCGISFGYFAELERLEARFGEGFVRLCAVGVPVWARRTLLRAPDRIAERVQGILERPTPDKDKIESIEAAAGLWQSEYDHMYPGVESPHRRMSRYYRHVRRWQAKFLRLAEQIAQVPPDFRRGPAYWLAVQAWREVFELHLEIGERLAREALSPELGLGQAEFLRAVRAAWARGGAGPWSREEGRAA